MALNGEHIRIFFNANVAFQKCVYGLLSILLNSTEPLSICPPLPPCLQPNLNWVNEKWNIWFGKGSTGQYLLQYLILNLVCLYLGTACYSLLFWLPGSMMPLPPPLQYFFSGKEEEGWAQYIYNILHCMVRC